MNDMRGGAQEGLGEGVKPAGHRTRGAGAGTG